MLPDKSDPWANGQSPGAQVESSAPPRKTSPRGCGDSKADFCAAIEKGRQDELALAQLAALAESEAVVRAFTCCDPASARAARDRGDDGPLAHLLFGAKDIITTAQFPTRYASERGEAERSRSDAWCVAAARRQGAVLLGKTVCTEFANPRPGPTANPWDPTRTPGGSSSGSAAAVAAGFLSFAFGTQTAGSTIRPASYCGVTGFKPSFGLVPLEGVKALSTTLDHIGLFARSPRDVWYVLTALVGTKAEIVEARRPARILAFELPAEIPQGDVYRARTDELMNALRREGVVAECRALPFPTSDFAGLQKELCYFEAARLLLRTDDPHVSEEAKTFFGPYLDVDIASYAAAVRRRLAYRGEFEALAAPYDAVLMPAATGAAPAWHDTGDAVMNRFWTALQAPAFSVPLWRSADAMPLGLQMLAGLGRDRELASIAQWFHENWCSAA